MTKFMKAIGAGAALMAVFAAKTCSKVGMIASHGGGTIIGEEAARIAPGGLHALEQAGGGAGAVRPLGHIDDLGAASHAANDATGASAATSDSGRAGSHADDATGATSNSDAHSEPWYHETGREVLKEGADGYMRYRDQQRDRDRQNSVRLFAPHDYKFAPAPQSEDAPSTPGYVRPDPGAP